MVLCSKSDLITNSQKCWTYCRDFIKNRCNNNWQNCDKTDIEALWCVYIAEFVTMPEKQSKNVK